MTPENITALQALVQADTALAQQLQSATTVDSAAQLLAKAASSKGLSVEAHDIAEHVKTGKDTQMSDTELEAVAGGLMNPAQFAAASIFSFGIACIVYSAQNSGPSFATCKAK